MNRDHQYGDAPVTEEYRAQMEATMRALDTFFNGEEAVKSGDRKAAIVVMVFPFGDPEISGRVNFMSNGVSRPDMVALFKEMISRFQGMPGAAGTA